MADFEERFVQELVAEVDCPESLAGDIAAKAAVYRADTDDDWTAADWIDMMQDAPHDDPTAMWNWAVGYRSTFLSGDLARFQL